MRTKHNYPIGTPGVPWGDDERKEWLESRRKYPDRDYHATICAFISSSSSSSSSSSLSSDEDADQCRRSSRRDIVGFVPVVYGTLVIGDGDHGNGGSGGSTMEEYPLLAFVAENSSFLHTPSDDDDEEEEKTTMSGIGINGGGGGSKPAILITGGVHGYETSGIFGALDFLTSGMAKYYSDYFDVVVVPCVSPWGYEYNERWTSNAIDPNRSFRRSTKRHHEPMRTEESSRLIAFLDGLGRRTTTTMERTPQWLCHVDLHETTDTDVTEYRPARAARDGHLDYDDHIPDGFYLFGAVDDDDEDEGVYIKQTEFYDAILAGVERVGSHLAVMETDGTLCGYRADKRGLLLLSRSECANMGICAVGALPDVPYAVTTEVYPDSSRTNEGDCVRAQVGAICAALDFLRRGLVVR